MSRHVTTLPIDVDPVIKALPKGYFLHGVTMNADHTAVLVHWEHDDSKTGKTYEVEYPVTKLAELAPKVVGPKQKLVTPTLWPFKNTVDSKK